MSQFHGSDVHDVGSRYRVQGPTTASGDRTKLTTEPELTTEPDLPTDLFDQARTIGGSCWLERSMFEMLGHWSTTETEPRVVMMLDDHSHRHAWHADVLLDRLPQLADVDPLALVVPSTSSVSATLDHAAEPVDTLSRLVGAYRVVCAHLIVEQRRLLEKVELVSSPSTHRWVLRIVDDLLDEWMSAEDVIRGLILCEEDVESASAHQQHLERLLLGH